MPAAPIRSKAKRTPVRIAVFFPGRKRRADDGITSRVGRCSARVGSCSSVPVGSCSDSVVGCSSVPVGSCSSVPVGSCSDSVVGCSVCDSVSRGCSGSWFSKISTFWGKRTAYGNWRAGVGEAQIPGAANRIDAPSAALVATWVIGRQFSFQDVSVALPDGLGNHASMDTYDSLLDLIGNTPLLRLKRVTADVRPQMLAKLEMLNPGGSVKDRIGIRMIEAAEGSGRLRPGGTIVEPTSGNTGVGLAIAASIKGYRCIFTMPDKMSQEKISLLRAYGAEVVIAPTAVPPESPESYYRVADRLAAEI